MEEDGLKFCILDTETTSLNTKTGNIIEIGWIVTDKELNVLKQQNFLINGDFEISEFIKNLTGISKEKTISDGVPLQTAFESLYEDIVKCQFIVAHNVVFDYNMIITEINNLFKDKEKEKNELEHYLNIFKSKIRLCSRYILQRECRERGLVPTNYKLQTLYNYLIDSEQSQSHRAIDDVYMILECFQELADFDILYYFWNKHLVFGKHKNQTNEWIYDNDKDYFNWLIKDVYKIDTLYKKDQLFYKDEEYEDDGFVVADNVIEYMNDNEEDPEDNEESIEEEVAENPAEDPVIPETNNLVGDSDEDSDYEESEESSTEEESDDYLSEDNDSSVEEVIHPTTKRRRLN